MNDGWRGTARQSLTLRRRRGPVSGSLAHGFSRTIQPVSSAAGVTNSVAELPSGAHDESAGRRLRFRAPYSFALRRSFRPDALGGASPHLGSEKLISFIADVRHRRSKMDLLDAVGRQLLAGRTPLGQADGSVIWMADSRARDQLTGGRIAAPLLIHETRDRGRSEQSISLMALEADGSARNEPPDVPRSVRRDLRNGADDGIARRILIRPIAAGQTRPDAFSDEMESGIAGVMGRIPDVVAPDDSQTVVDLFRIRTEESPALRSGG